MIKKGYSKELDDKLEKIRKERIKLQTANIERGRVDRSSSRQEMYYEYVGSVCEALPLPSFYDIIGASVVRLYLAPFPLYRADCSCTDFL